MQEFSVQTRHQNIQKLKKDKFDVLIIGGGITGAGVARDAALRGLKVALIEKHDFASGTSSRSSKLVHGGIRYLENLDFKLVFEALSERSKLFEMAPHLVHPLRFMIPLFEDSRVGMFKMGLGMWLYDALALFQTPEMHERLNAAESLQRNPALKKDNLVGSYVYSDAYMDDDRLVHETLRSAHQAGAVCVNYVAAESSNIQDGVVRSVLVKDQLSSEKWTLEADQVVSTVGPWTDLVGEKLVNDWKKILRPTKGIHLTLPNEKIKLSSAVVMGAQESDRIVFAIPRHEMVIIGTTDTDYKEDPANAQTEVSDVDYLLEVTQHYFPQAQLQKQDILSSYVGVRPLVQDQSGSAGKTSREHVIISDKRNFHFVAGGKYTTYRLMSEQIVDRVLRNLPIEQRLKYKKCETAQPLNALASVEALEVATLKALKPIEAKLVERHGLEAFEMIERYGHKSTYWEIEAQHAIRTTMCLNLIDFFTRRVPLMLSSADHGMSVLNEVAAVFKRELILTTAEIEQQKNQYYDYINRELAWRKN